MFNSRVFFQNAELCDVLISGGGLGGSIMMGALQQLRKRLGSDRAAPLKCLSMIDAAPHPVYNATNPMCHLRTVSITPVSSKIIEKVGLWNKLSTKHAYYRLSIRHEHANSPHNLSLSKTKSSPLLDLVDFNTPVGFMCFNSEMHASMVSVVEEENKLSNNPDSILFESKISELFLPPQDEMDGCLGRAIINENETNFRLLLGCDGRDSSLKSRIESPSLQHDYSQTAFVCPVQLVKPCDGNVSAFQNFFTDGKIIALLPMSEDSGNIVFSTTPSHAKELFEMSNEELVNELNKRLYEFAPSDIPKVLDVPVYNDKRVQGCFPLRLTVATKPYAPRAICVGDAAHGIHPFAGQGLNLGIYDIAALTETLERAVVTGHDIGNSVIVGQRFAAEMLAHTLPIISGMEFVKLMCSSSPSLSTRGMKIINKFSPLSYPIKKALLYAGSGGTFARRHKNCFLLQN